MDNDQTFKTKLLGLVAGLQEGNCQIIYERIIGDVQGTRTDTSYSTSLFDNYHRVDANEAALSGTTMHNDATAAADAAQRKRAARAARIAANGVNSLR
jgi:hypothetical protein